MLLLEMHLLGCRAEQWLSAIAHRSMQAWALEGGADTNAQKPRTHDGTFPAWVLPVLCCLCVMQRVQAIVARDKVAHVAWYHVYLTPWLASPCSYRLALSSPPGLNCRRSFFASQVQTASLHISASQTHCSRHVLFGRQLHGSLRHLHACTCIAINLALHG